MADKSAPAADCDVFFHRLYKILLSFDIMYSKMTDPEKKKLIRKFIEEIGLYSEKWANGRILTRKDYEIEF